VSFYAFDAGVVAAGGSMPKRRYESREPTHEWQQIRPLLQDTAQITYEIIRDPFFFGAKRQRSEEKKQGYLHERFTIKPISLIRQVWLLCCHQNLPHPFPSRISENFPLLIRQELVDLHAEYPEFHPTRAGDHLLCEVRSQAVS
jgi:hypothetical protein